MNVYHITNAHASTKKIKNHAFRKILPLPLALNLPPPLSLTDYQPASNIFN